MGSNVTHPRFLTNHDNEKFNIENDEKGMREIQIPLWLGREESKNKAVTGFLGNGSLKQLLLPKLLEEGWDDVPALKMMSPQDIAQEFILLTK